MTVLNGTLSYPPLLFVKPSINMYIFTPTTPRVLLLLFHLLTSLLLVET